jgi:trehalose-6-phosphate synthase
MTPQELRQALDAYRVKEATGKVRVKKSLLDKATFKTYRGKDKAVLSGDPKKVKKYAHLMTSEEYRRAIDRCNAATELKLQSLKKLNAYGETIAKGIGSAANIATSAISLHDSMATIYNATNKSGKTWKKWNESETEKKWKKQEKEMTKIKFAIQNGWDIDTGKAITSDSKYYEPYQNYMKQKLKPDVFKDLFGD